MQFTANLKLTSETPVAPRLYGFARSLIFAIGLALASMTGVFEPFDGLLYDAFVRHSSDSNAINRKVVIVEAQAVDFSSSSIRWNMLATDLIKHGASQVVFTSIPNGSHEVIESLLKQQKVIVSTNLRNATALATPAISGASSESGSPFFHAVSAVADPLIGVHRGQRYMYRTGGTDLPSLEALAASRLGVDVPREGRYLIDFSGNGSRFPRVTLNQILNGEVSESVLHGRTVMIGPVADAGQRTVVTPITESGREVTELDYHAYALDTLLRGKEITLFGPVAMAAIIIGIWLLCIVLLQSMQFQQAVLASAFIATGLLLLSWWLVSTTCHLPVIGPILVVASSLIAVFLSKTKSQNEALERIATEASLSASARLVGAGATRNEAFWSDVLDMVDHLLPVTRVVLLERDDGSNHLSEVHSLRCSDNAVEERRRDFRRAPYSTAIEKGKAVETRQYLIDAEQDEHQFLAPLLWGGKLLGFWAFGIRRSQMANRATLMHAVDLLGKQLSELMFARQQGITHSKIAAGWRDRLVDQRDMSILNLSQHLSTLDNHIHVLEDVLNGMEVPTMVTDLFGRPLLSNASMKALAQPKDSPVAADSVANLLETLCRLSPDAVRVALADVVFNGNRFEPSACIGRQCYRLRVSRLHNGARAMTGREVLQHVRGLMVQLFPVAGAKADIRLPSESRTRVALPTSEIITVADVPEVEEVNLLDVMDEAIASIAASCGNEALNVAINGARQDVKVLAQRGKLKDVLATLVRFLAEDSRQQGEITVNLDTQNDGLVIGMKNKGFGMPDDKLQAMLEGGDIPRSSDLRRLRQLRKSAAGTHGKLDLRSTVGGGYEAKLTMRLAG